MLRKQSDETILNTGILDRFLQTAEGIEISGRSYRLKDRADKFKG